MEAELKDLLTEAQSLSPLQQSKVAAVMGALVADAASQPIHWIYNPEAMDKAVSECRDAPEFLPVSANPFYTLPTGSQSPYGDQLLVMLESLVECRGYDAKKIAEKMFLNFGPGSPYDRSLSDKYSKTQSDRSMYPVQGKWQNFQLRRFAQCHAKGESVEDMKEEDKNIDPDNIIRNIPLVVMLAGKADMLDIFLDSSRQFQTNDLMIALLTAVARLVEFYVLHEYPGCQDNDPSTHPLESVVRELKRPGRGCAGDLDLAMAAHFKKVLECGDLSVDAATSKFGKA